jgi:hypothetical protein
MDQDRIATLAHGTLHVHGKSELRFARDLLEMGSKLQRDGRVTWETGRGCVQTEVCGGLVEKRSPGVQVLAWDAL